MEETVYKSAEQMKASGLSKTNPINQRSGHVTGLVERLELLILETKVGHDGLYDEMLKITMNNINQEQLDNLFLIMVNIETTKHK